MSETPGVARTSDPLDGDVGSVTLIPSAVDGVDDQRGMIKVLEGERSVAIGVVRLVGDVRCWRQG